MGSIDGGGGRREVGIGGRAVCVGLAARLTGFVDARRNATIVPRRAVSLRKEVLSLSVANAFHAPGNQSVAMNCEPVRFEVSRCRERVTASFIVSFASDASREEVTASFIVSLHRDAS